MDLVTFHHWITARKMFTIVLKQTEISKGNYQKFSDSWNCSACVKCCWIFFADFYHNAAALIHADNRQCFACINSLISFSRSCSCSRLQLWTRQSQLVNRKIFFFLKMCHLRVLTCPEKYSDSMFPLVIMGISLNWVFPEWNRKWTLNGVTSDTISSVPS